MEDAPPSLRSELPEVGELPLGELLAVDASALHLALVRLRDEAAHDERFAGWSSAI